MPHLPLAAWRQAGGEEGEGLAAGKAAAFCRLGYGSAVHPHWVPSWGGRSVTGTTPLPTLCAFL